MSKEKWFHIQEKAQANSGISIVEKEPCTTSTEMQVTSHHNGLIEKWVDTKAQNALNHVPSGEGIIDLMIEKEGESVCKTVAAEEEMSKDMHKIEAHFVTDTKFKRLGGTFRRY